MNQVIIIGKGPAGISAAIYLKRAGIDPIVIGKDLGALGDYKSTIENYYGFDQPIDGKKLIEDGIKQASFLGIQIIDETVISIKDNIDHFSVITKTSNLQSETVLLATGKTRENLSIPGYRKFKGKGISMCATCDGYFYRKKKIGIVGCGHYMKHELEYLSRMTKDITVFTHGNELDEDLGFPIIKEPILEFGGIDKISYVKTKNGTHEVDGLFIALGAPSSIEFANQLGLIVEKGNLIINQEYQTNVPGIFAAGDITGGKLQIAKAVYDGMEVADYIYKYLKFKKTKTA
ncbi:MAG: NAD(P)/FAD-dependent oxidoreductase [Acholeplasmataceae bacterium]|jgi:thioredoxin reductase (NADPH)|nr:NAD(P)/FAD-dependent oxidoreductase [Acholeplasmataceae bacterium]MDD4193779.1 NAD(P)/FAD-dependent oxidoreductase [Acholeplasmataceae bacterium]MDY0338556.1 NAD(P)/FAD-dependent oxidoreductase [Acholeplasmataceae bacterium]